ncbi:MAG: HlyC/CorC family transporter [Burkholderiales bacterium]|jgi:magnesium and cobalt transporter|nr:CBS domain-containing protein [Betaproteobacteria bacterium]
MDDPSHKPGLLDRLSALLLREPEDREQLIELLHSAYERHLIDSDALSIIEGALAMSEMAVRDVMVPRAQMDMIDIADPPETFIPFVLEMAHSRFPVFEGERDKVLGILLAKDLLRFYAEETFDVREMLRPAVFVPESKRLNMLLRDFRANRNHMAVVVDEYGGVAGLVTIEDVLEQIVGDIDDEYDYDEDEDNIVEERPGHYRCKAQTEIADFNEMLFADLPLDDVDTLGGLVVRALGRVPKRGEKVNVGGFHFQVLRADSRRIHTLLVQRVLSADDEVLPQ